MKGFFNPQGFGTKKKILELVTHCILNNYKATKANFQKSK